MNLTAIEPGTTAKVEFVDGEIGNYVIEGSDNIGLVARGEGTGQLCLLPWSAIVAVVLDEEER